MFGLTARQTRLVMAAVTAFLISGTGIFLGGDPATGLAASPWLLPVQSLIGAVAAAVGWTETSAE